MNQRPHVHTQRSTQRILLVQIESIGSVRGQPGELVTTSDMENIVNRFFKFSSVDCLKGTTGGKSVAHRA